jgi:hypothetical protein
MGGRWREIGREVGRRCGVRCGVRCGGIGSRLHLALLHLLVAAHHLVEADDDLVHREAVAALLGLLGFGFGFGFGFGVKVRFRVRFRVRGWGF